MLFIQVYMYTCIYILILLLQQDERSLLCIYTQLHIVYLFTLYFLLILLFCFRSFNRSGEIEKIRNQTPCLACTNLATEVNRVQV